MSLRLGMDYLFTTYFEHSDFQQIHIQKQYEDLQDFIDANQISSKDFEMLGEWEKNSPLFYLNYMQMINVYIVQFMMLL